MSEKNTIGMNKDPFILEDDYKENSEFVEDLKNNLDKLESLEMLGNKQPKKRSRSEEIKKRRKEKALKIKKEIIEKESIRKLEVEKLLSYAIEEREKKEKYKYHISPIGSYDEEYASYVINNNKEIYMRQLEKTVDYLKMHSKEEKSMEEFKKEAKNLIVNTLQILEKEKQTGYVAPPSNDGKMEYVMLIIKEHMVEKELMFSYFETKYSDKSVHIYK